MHIGNILRKLCEWTGVEIIEASINRENKKTGKPGFFINPIFY